MFSHDTGGYPGRKTCQLPRRVGNDCRLAELWNAINASIHYFSVKKNKFSLKRNLFFQRKIDRFFL